MHVPLSTFCGTYGLHRDTSDSVWVRVGSWSAILEVTVTLVRTLSWNTDRGTTVGDTVAELFDVSGLVLASQTHSVVLTVNGNVLLVTTLELLDGSLDGLHTAWLTHLSTGVVAVEASSVPVSWNRLRVERDLGTEFLGDTGKEETGHPEIITHCGAVSTRERRGLCKEQGTHTLDTRARSNLELPLGRHDLSVGARDQNTGVHASLEMRLNNVPAEDLASANTTVVGALGSWVTVCWPAIWSVGDIEQGVFLLKTKPWVVGSVGLHELRRVVAVIELVRGSIWVPALGQDEDVWRTADWVRVDSTWTDVDVGVVAWSLAS